MCGMHQVSKLTHACTLVTRSVHGVYICNSLLCQITNAYCVQLTIIMCTINIPAFICASCM